MVTLGCDQSRDQSRDQNLDYLHFYVHLQKILFYLHLTKEDEREEEQIYSKFDLMSGTWESTRIFQGFLHEVASCLKMPRQVHMQLVRESGLINCLAATQ